MLLSNGWIVSDAGRKQQKELPVVERYEDPEHKQISHPMR